jgi:RTA1 like protein
MPSFICYPPSDPDSLYLYCPSFGAAITFSCFFGITSIAHIIQAIIYKKPFSWVLIMGALWECGGYVFRSLSVTAQKHVGWVTVQSLFILLAPLWINTFVYMLLGRMVHFFLDGRKVYGVKAKHFTWLFVSLDILSFLIQAAGGLMASGKNAPQVVKNGLNVYMAGMGVQEFIILIFVSMAVRFQKKLTQQEQRGFNAGQGVSMSEYRTAPQARKLLYVVYTVLGLITLRIIFRLVEFSQGFTSDLASHEWFVYVFDAVPMLAAIVAINLLHPGRILRGPNSDFTEERRADKQMKKERKDMKRAEKESKRAAKQQEKDAGKGADATVRDVEYADI